MRLKKREIPTSMRGINVQEGDGVKKRESSPKEGDLTCMSKDMSKDQKVTDTDAAPLI